MNTANISKDSSLALAVPPEEYSEIPDNEPVDSLAPKPEEKQPGHIPIDIAAIDPHLREIPQSPYTKGNGDETRAKLRVPFFPHGFTLSAVLSDDLSEIVDADVAIPAVDEKGHPEKRALHIEVFCNPAYARRVHTNQARVISTRGAMAIFAAEQIREIIDDIPNFPYELKQIRVLSIDVRSRGTVQPRLFVDGFVMAQQQPDDCLGMMVAQVVPANP
ncbi:hypothetical protein GSI_14808 [Ganoderma sinense ZZ0214-1]|uniref:Uncharacterized protein n=1 Tax=Ganoderma sinense ZZ0214-1 TaxID=1077348 RepID=A0A2G8RPR6_9APHY|nr:hypothetical protein GSI_14808 [Ganoderma sinense ZZ0214-1]